jgi:hypothetical protein
MSRNFRALLPVAALATVLGAGLAFLPQGASRAAAAACRATGPFTTSGTKILAGDGSRYIPFGVTVSGIEHEADYSDWLAEDHDEIAGLADKCVNTVRLQVAQQAITDPGYQAALRAEVDQAESLGLVVVINDQTEESGNQVAPVAATKTFWKTVLSDMGYASDPQVMADLFNEPRGSVGWACWRNGSSACSYTGTVGMQALASYVRGMAPHTLMWVETPAMAASLASWPSYPITGTNVVAEFHHPSGAHTTANWDKVFGFMVQTYRKVPVVDGEWAQYAADRGECWDDAPARAPAYLAYLWDQRIGVTAWTMFPGSLVRSADYDDLTTMGPASTWKCAGTLTYGPAPVLSPSLPDRGMGSALFAWMAQHNGG